MPSKNAFVRALALTCVLLVAFAGFVQAVHVHSDNARVPSHECSICAVAHAGIQGKVEYRPVTVFVRSALVVAPDVATGSRGFVSALRIRPPPAV